MRYRVRVSEIPIPAFGKEDLGPDSGAQRGRKTQVFFRTQRIRELNMAIIKSKRALDSEDIDCGADKESACPSIPRKSRERFLSRSDAAHGS